MRLPNQDSATGRGVKTGIQSVAGLVLAFVGGLLLTIWHVPGVPEATVNYLGSHLVQLAVVVGIPSGVVSFVWNYLRSDIKNY